MNTPDYKLISEQIRAFAETDPWYVPFLSNVSALLYENLQDINWAGFYLMREGRLVLGPFQGKTACIHIEVGKGVCGTAVMEKNVIRVEDVHTFPGHIACDAASESEIVLPLFKGDEVIGVLDIDSPHKGRFDEADEEGLRLAAETVSELVSMTD
ncbi:MAG: GAF domain-containing protein [Lachnospiraceae bacterium]|nr:GAF domain-containing protein [Lachnospiraceae bacterium]